MALNRADIESIKRFSSAAEVAMYVRERGLSCTEEQAAALLKVARSGQGDEALQAAVGALGGCFLICGESYFVPEFIPC